jgi:hypothetical protein
MVSLIRCFADSCWYQTYPCTRVHEGPRSCLWVGSTTFSTHFDCFAQGLDLAPKCILQFTHGSGCRPTHTIDLFSLPQAGVCILFVNLPYTYITTRKILWGSKIEKSPPSVTYTEVMNDNDKGLYRWLTNVVRMQIESLRRLSYPRTGQIWFLLRLRGSCNAWGHRGTLPTYRLYQRNPVYVLRTSTLSPRFEWA